MTIKPSRTPFSHTFSEIAFSGKPFNAWERRTFRMRFALHS